MARGGLGRGLSALIADSADFVAPEAGEISELPIGVIEASAYQVRTEFGEDELGELADSIRINGVVQPILVRSHAQREGVYELIAGERRWRASGLAGRKTIPAIVRQVDDKTAMEIGLVENVQRENLNVMEEAEGYKRLMDEFGYKQDDVAKTVGKGRATVSNAVRLLTLPESVQMQIREGALSGGHARALLTAKDPEIIAEQIVKKGLSVRQTEQLMQKVTGNVRTPLVATNRVALAPLEQRLADLTGLSLQVHPAANGAGKLTIRYDSEAALLEIIARLGDEAEGADMAELQSLIV